MPTASGTNSPTDRQDSRIQCEIAAILNALAEGEASGPPTPFDFAEFKQRKEAQHR